MIIHLSVTQADIDAGVPKNSCQCPVALALKRHLDTVEVATGEINGWLQGRYYRGYKELIDNFIDAFDNQDKKEFYLEGIDFSLIKPFECDIELLEVELDQE